MEGPGRSNTSCSRVVSGLRTPKRARKKASPMTRWLMSSPRRATGSVSVHWARACEAAHLPCKRLLCGLSCDLFYTRSLFGSTQPTGKQRQGRWESTWLVEVVTQMLALQVSREQNAPVPVLIFTRCFKDEVRSEMDWALAAKQPPLARGSEPNRDMHISLPTMAWCCS